MKYTCMMGVVFMPNMAVAHIGHIGEVAGHDHLLGLAALGLAGLAAALGAKAKGKKETKAQAEETSTEDEPELQEA